MAQGYIASITPKETKAGTMYDFMIDGRKIGAGKFPPKGFQAGDFVNYEVTENGNFLNLKAGSMSKATPPAGVAAPAPASTATGRALANHDAKDEAYSRGASLNSAMAFVKILADSDSLPFAANTKKDVKADLIFQVVQEYTERIYELTTGRKLTLAKPETGVAGGDLSAEEEPDNWNE